MKILELIVLIIRQIFPSMARSIHIDSLAWKNIYLMKKTIMLGIITLFQED